MSPHPSFEPDALPSALEAAGFIGIWTYDVWADRLTLSAVLAGLIGIDAEAGSRGVPVALLLAGTHGEDRARIENAVHAAGEHGGPFEVEFRTRPGLGVRWLGLRGRVTCDPSGRAARGRGIAVDLTEQRAVGEASGLRAQGRVNQMAEHAIALRGLVDGLQRPTLAKLVDGVMVEIGIELARHLNDAEPGRRH